MKRILLLAVPLFSLSTMVLLMTICIQPTARAQNNTAAPQIWVTATSLPVTRNPVEGHSHRSRSVESVIYWGGGRSDARWMDRARLRINAIQGAGINPEHIIFVSWDKYPTRTLPETDPTALASLIVYYFEHAR